MTITVPEETTQPAEQALRTYYVADTNNVILDERAFSSDEAALDWFLQTQLPDCTLWKLSNHPLIIKQSVGYTLNKRVCIPIHIPAPKPTRIKIENYPSLWQ